MASYFEVVLGSVPSLECCCCVSPSLAAAIPSQVSGWNVQPCGRPLGPFSQAYGTPSGGGFCLEHTDAVRFLKDSQERLSFPTCLQDKTRTRLCGVRASSSKLFPPPRFRSRLGRCRDLTAAASTFRPSIWAWPRDCPGGRAAAHVTLRSSPCWMARLPLLRGTRPR